MEYRQSLEYLYGLQRFGMKLGLDNMRALLANLGEPQSGLPCVHVAGTNGKGSVCAFLAEILKLSGLKVGLYTSPHLHCFTERIRIEGKPVSRTYMAALAADIRQAGEGIPATFFEAATSMALLAFRQQDVAIAVVETGLGGRLDATNVIQPVLTMITPVSHDHQEHLGESLAEIAAEKAGILKPGVPVVVGRQTPEVTGVLLDAADSCSAPVCLADRDYRWHGDHSDFNLTWQDQTLSGMRCRLAGEHQLDNLAQALGGALTLQALGWSVTAQAMQRSGETTAWPGRLEWWTGPNEILLDAAHNAAGIARLASYLKARGGNRLSFLVGLSRGRNPDDVLKSLAGIAANVYAVPVPVGETVDPSALVAWAGRHGIASRGYPSAQAGLDACLADLRQAQPLIVCGSLFLVAAVREMLFPRAFKIVEGRVLDDRALTETVSVK
jgi:dihydrofolate synthase / folylpolyglutamate synthase